MTKLFNIAQLPVSDINNPILNSNITVLTNITKEVAHNVLVALTPKYTYVPLNTTGILFLDNSGSRLAYYSLSESSLTIDPAYKNVFIQSQEAPVVAEKQANVDTTKPYTVCFTGHRPKDLPGNDYDYNKPESFAILNSMYSELKSRVEAYGSIRVVSGMAQGIDQLAIIAADKLRSNLGADKVQIHGAIPCQNFEDGWKKVPKSIEVYRSLLDKCDTSEIVYKDGDYNHSKVAFAGKPKGENCSMGQRNIYMVEMSDEVLAYWNGKAGGTGNCVNSANSRNKKVSVFNPLDIVSKAQTTVTIAPQTNTSNVNIPLDLEADRKQYAGSFGVQQQPQQSSLAQRRVLTVDGACSGNPGTFEYQAVWEDNNERLFHKHYGSLKGTNNIAEFLGLASVVHYIIKNNLFDSVEVHSDSVTAMAWVKACKHNSKSKTVDKEVLDYLYAAETFLYNNKEAVGRVIIKKHDTKANGEIAADFGNKSGK